MIIIKVRVIKTGSFSSSYMIGTFADSISMVDIKRAANQITMDLVALAEVNVIPRFIDDINPYGILYRPHVNIHQAVYDRIKNLVAGSEEHYEDYYDPESLSEKWFIQSIVKELEKRKQELRFLRKVKLEHIRNLLRNIWLRRNDGVGRSCTETISDPLALSIPTPPTAVAAIRSLERGGVVIAFSK